MSDNRNVSVPDNAPAAGPSTAQKLVVGALMAVAVVYLVNPTLGVLELLPDNLPILGNLDEATATAILVSGLNYFGVNVPWLTQIFGQGASKAKRKREG